MIEKGLIEVLIFMAIMSINLGLINLLPIPVLDGGHLCFYIYEAIFKKPLSSTFQIVLLKFVFIFLIGCFFDHLPFSTFIVSPIV